MKSFNYKAWTITIASGLALTFGLGDMLSTMLGGHTQTANAFQRGGGGGGRGGGGGGGGGGNRGGGGGGGGGGGNRGGGGGFQGGGGGGFRGGGAAHPGGGGGGSVNRAPSRTPSFSQPNFTPRANVNPGVSRGATSQPRVVAPGGRVQGGAGARVTGPNANIGTPRTTNRIVTPNAGVRGNVNVNPNTGRARVNVNPSGPGRVTVRGNVNNNVNRNANTLNLGNRRLALGPNNYRPAYLNHRLYHGYWGGGYGYGGRGFGLYGPWGRYGGYGGYGGYGRYGYGGYGGYGRGFGLGFGLGYGLAGLGYGYGGYGYGLGAGFGYRPLGWGYGGWGLGSLAYNSGYLGYYNPYWGGGQNFGGYSYAQPIPVSYASTDTGDDPNSTAQSQILDNAVAAFRQNDYDAALDIVNQGITQYPTDSVLHEFRGLTLFAKGDYQQAASTIHSVLAVGPGWDWATVSNIYPDVSIYTQQLRALEAFTRSNPQDAGSRFLLGYQYMTNGYPESAQRQFEQVAKLQPNDRVARDVLTMIKSQSDSQVAAAGTPATAQPGQEPTPALQEPPEAVAQRPADADVPQGKPLDEAALMGTWKATREDGSQFQLTISEDKKFNWQFTPKGGKPTAFGGTYTIDGPVLALESKEGGSLIAGVIQEDGKFNFKLIGSPKEDPGLNFTK